MRGKEKVDKHLDRARLNRKSRLLKLSISTKAFNLTTIAKIFLKETQLEHRKKTKKMTH